MEGGWSRKWACISRTGSQLASGSGQGVGSTHLRLFLAPSTAIVAASLCEAFGAENIAAETAVVSSDGCAEFSAASLWHKGLRATLDG